MVAVLLLFLCSLLSAQLRVDLGIAAGQQSYDPHDIGSRLLVSPEAMLSRGPLALYYAVDYAELSSASIRRGSMYASHLGLAYRWPIGRNLAVRSLASPHPEGGAEPRRDHRWHRGRSCGRDWPGADRVGLASSALRLRGRLRFRDRFGWRTR